MQKQFTLYRSDYREKAYIADYPHKETISSLADLLRVTQKDHIFSEMKDNHRHEDNYLSTDCIVLDLDNTFSEDPGEWKTIDDIAEALPEVSFYYVESRNHMKPKEKKNSKGVTTYEEPRPKYHLYFPLSKKITDHKEINRLMLEAAGLYCYMDLASAEPQHFFYGVQNTKGGEIDGNLTIDEYIAECGEDLQKMITDNLNEYEGSVKAGLYKANNETQKAISRLNTYIGRQTAPTIQPEEYSVEDPVAWIEDAERDKTVKWLENWAEENGVELGKRYKVNTKTHPNAIVICVTCPWEDEHSMNGAENETVIIIDAGGQLHFLCRHSHGIGLTWKDYRKKIEENSPTAQRIDAGYKDYIEQQAETTEQQKEEYLKKSAAYCLQDFQREIEETAEAPAVSTGFYELDSILEGGLFPGLYFIGAVSSLGKTSFCLQIADQIAKSGKDVILFSLEMARNELMAKSISRLTYLKAQDKHHPKTTRGILAGSRYKGYTETEKALIEKAKGIYKEYASHIFIYEGVGDIGVDQVKEIIQQHIAITKNRPIVFIDYLQILAPYDMRASDKQNTDKAVLELKRLSRDYKIPIVAISSFNRDNYTQPVNMAAFKESGAVEYSSDVLIGLQYEGMDYREGEKENERNKRIRELIARQEDQGRKGEAQNIQLKILKNRNGSKGQLLFDFISMFNYYRERDNGFLSLDDSVDMDEIFNSMRKK